MAEITELENKLKFILQDLKDCVDLSLQISNENPHAKSQLHNCWQQFLQDLLEYVRRRTKDKGEDLFKRLSLAKLYKLW